MNAIQFKVSTRTIEYGDKRKFVEYRIVFHAHGKPVGIEIGPRRQTATRSECISAARKRIAKLRKHRLVVIPVTGKHIRDGQARSCSRCAIAEALYCKQAEMGFPQNEYSFEVSTYGAFVDPRGIELKPASWVQSKDLAVPIERVPEILVWVSPKGRACSEDMATWTMNWDDWAEARYMSAKEWRDEHWDEKPTRPGPCSFVLDLDEFKPVVAEKEA